MKTVQILLAANLALALALPAPAAAFSTPEVQLLQPGDKDKSCDALAAEINALAAAEAPQPPVKRKKKGLGFLGQALSAASPMLGSFGGSGMGGAIASQAIGAAQASAMQAQMQYQMDGAMAMATPAGLSIETQRKARLMGFFESKGC